jgi:hypothetical protein
MAYILACDRPEILRKKSPRPHPPRRARASRASLYASLAQHNCWTNPVLSGGGRARPWAGGGMREGGRRSPHARARPRTEGGPQPSASDSSASDSSVLESTSGRNVSRRIP